MEPVRMRKELGNWARYAATALAIAGAVLLVAANPSLGGVLQAATGAMLFLAAVFV
jgi:hypothetical protein